MDEQKQDAVAAEPGVDELSKAKAQCEEYLAGWKRAMADYANLKKDSERAQGEMARYASAGLVMKLLPVLDSFRKAASQAPKFQPDQPPDFSALRNWVDGINAIAGQLDGALKAAGVALVDESGVSFDPSLHEAMMAQKSDGAKEGTVLKILEPGYKMHDRVLRPAKVIVAE